MHAIEIRGPAANQVLKHLKMNDKVIASSSPLGKSFLLEDPIPVYSAFGLLKVTVRLAG